MENYYFFWHTGVAAKIVNVCCVLHNICIHYKVMGACNDLTDMGILEEKLTPSKSSKNLASAQAKEPNW